MTQQRIISLDSQILNSVQSCAKRTEYQFINNLRPQVKAEAFERGDLMHKPLEFYYTVLGNCINWETEFWKECRASLEITPEVISQVSDHHQAHSLIVQKAVKVANYFASKMSIDLDESESVIYQFKEYCEFYRYDGWRPLAVEEVGSKVLYEDEELKIVYNFKIDLIAEKGNLILAWDHKTSKRRENPTPNDNQVEGYAWGTGLKVMINKIGFQKTLKPEERFQRFPLQITTPKVSEWVDNTIYWAKVLDYYQQSGNWPMQQSQCRGRYADCDFLEVCEKDPENRDWELQKNFKVEKPWDVASILESK
jgi:PD-(D/E)XK nuclease superfamily